MKNVADESEVLPEIKARKNIFLTGSAGSGKTYMAKNIAETLPGAVMTATTGVAALNVGGETIHRFLGIGVSTRPEELGKIIARWEKTKRSTTPWDSAKVDLMNRLRVLITDEVSMLRKDQFELIDASLSYIKDNPLPFGGIQIVAVGDFLQLPPVVTTHDARAYSDLVEPFCFQSGVWAQAGIESFNLTSNYRQGEGEFLSALENIRIGNVTAEIDELMKSRVGAKFNTPMQPVKLFSLKVDVNKENIDCLKLLPGEKYVSEAEYEGKEYDTNILKKECPAQDRLFFCKDAQVMMLTNDPGKRWVNGTLGIIRSCSPLTVQLSNGLTVPVDLHVWERTVPIVDPNTKVIRSKILARMKQYPFVLSWATSVHKSQGITLDYVDIDLQNTFAPGMAYVALSRVKTLEGLTLRNWNKKVVKADKEVLKFYGK